ncbi:tetratricopeptide repeat protein, partial [Acidobacteria bacterium AH-259-D05]|nr:tetratricopeptide repeat protein [Acidobacteria bacterium AH-259-D05]
MSDWLKRYPLIDKGLAPGFPYLGYREICEVSDARPAVIDEMGEWEKIFGKDIVKPYYRLLSVLNGPFVRTTHSVPAVFEEQDPKNWEPDFLWAKTQVATLTNMNSRNNEDCFKLDVAEGMAADLYAVLEQALASLYHAQGKYAETEPLFRRSLAIGEKVLGPEHPNVATSLNNLAELYRAQGKYAEAEPLYQRALAIREKALGPEHPNVGQSLNNLAELYHAQGKYAEAESLYQRALAIWEKALGPEHPDVGQSLNNLANLYYNQGKYAEAESLNQRALAIREKALGPEHPNVGQSLNNLASLYHAQGK